MAKVCVGGTFNVIHDGHLALLRRAFAAGDELFIGLTSDSMVRGSRSVPVLGYEVRLKRLTEALSAMCGGKPFHIFRIDDEMGPAATEDYDRIAVSADTLPGAQRINRERTARGLKPLEVIVIDMVLGGDGEPLSSTRILRGRAGEKGGSKDNA